MWFQSDSFHMLCHCYHAYDNRMKIWKLFCGYCWKFENRLTHDDSKLSIQFSHFMYFDILIGWHCRHYYFIDKKGVSFRRKVKINLCEMLTFFLLVLQTVYRIPNWRMIFQYMPKIKEPIIMCQIFFFYGKHF